MRTSERMTRFARYHTSQQDHMKHARYLKRNPIHFCTPRQMQSLIRTEVVRAREANRQAVRLWWNRGKDQ